jgi:hypothetical protein
MAARIKMAVFGIVALCGMEDVSSDCPVDGGSKDL